MLLGLKSTIKEQTFLTKYFSQPENVEIETVLSLMSDGVPDSGEICPVLPSHLLQRQGFVVQIRWKLLRTSWAITDGLENSWPRRVSCTGSKPEENIMCCYLFYFVLWKVLSYNWYNDKFAHNCEDSWDNFISSG